jgi:hypothetical protein
MAPDHGDALESRGFESVRMDEWLIGVVVLVLLEVFETQAH